MRRALVISLAARAIAIAGLLAVIWLLLLSPLQNWKAKGVADRARTVSEIQRLQDTIWRLDAESRRRTENEGQKLIWSGSQAGEITAMIQTNLSQAASENGVGLRSITPLRQRQIQHLQAAGFRLEFEAGLDQLASFLKQIEYSSPALLVGKASLRKVVRPANERQQPLLSAQIEVVAPYRLISEPAE